MDLERVLKVGLTWSNLLCTSIEFKLIGDCNIDDAFLGLLFSINSDCFLRKSILRSDNWASYSSAAVYWIASYADMSSILEGSLTLPLTLWRTWSTLVCLPLINLFREFFISFLKSSFNLGEKWLSSTLRGLLVIWSKLRPAMRGIFRLLYYLLFCSLCRLSLVYLGE